MTDSPAAPDSPADTTFDELALPGVVLLTSTGIAASVATAAIAATLRARGNTVAVEHPGLGGQPVVAHAKHLIEVSAAVDVVLVEGAGGLLTRLDARGGTLADLAIGLRYKGVGAGFICVAAPGVTDLNTVMLTAEALQRRELPLVGVVVADWPTEPTPDDEAALLELPRAAGARLLGRVPLGGGALSEGQLAVEAPGWFAVGSR